MPEPLSAVAVLGKVAAQLRRLEGELSLVAQIVERLVAAQSRRHVEPGSGEGEPVASPS